MRSSALFVLSVVSVLLLCLPAGAERRAPFASGSGHMETADGSFRNFTFTAHLDEEGNARGRAHLNNREQGVTLFMEIDCLRVEGNVATMSGTHRKVKGEEYEGLPFWFRVVDNGEGPDAPADEMTLVSTFFGTGIDCETDFVLSPNTDLIPVTQGEIQVHGE